MNKTCILTDELAQFLDLSFSGQDRVQRMPMAVQVAGLSPAEVNELRPAQLPFVRSAAPLPVLSPPSVDAFVQAFTNLSRQYTEIVCVLSSARLTDCFDNAVKAAEITRGRCKIALVDTGAVGVGLGVLVAAAAGRAAAGADSAEIKRYVMGISNKVYSIFCVRNLAYLERLKLASPAQAFVGEMLDVHQLYYLNLGTLIPVQKARNSRHLVESLLEFVSEFEDPRNVTLQQSASGYHQEARTVRERLAQEYPEVEIREMAMTLPLASLFGPQTFGLFLWELPQ